MLHCFLLRMCLRFYGPPSVQYPHFTPLTNSPHNGSRFQIPFVATHPTETPYTLEKRNVHPHRVARPKQRNMAQSKQSHMKYRAIQKRPAHNGSTLNHSELAFLTNTVRDGRSGLGVLTRLDGDGHASASHEQSHNGEQRGACSTGERQLGDGLDVLHGLFRRVDQAPRIGSGGQNS